jgi:putative transcriptional regulator
VLRAEREWSQARLADALEVSRQTVNAIETGKYDPSLPLAFRIARVFEQPIEAIFFPDGTAGDEERVEPRGGALPDVSADWA